MNGKTVLGFASLFALTSAVLATPPGAADGSKIAGNGGKTGGFLSRARMGFAQKGRAPMPRVVLGTPTYPLIIDTVEVVVFTPQRPVRVRLHLQSEGKQLSEIWQQKLRTMFDYFDRDKDGFLSEAEVQNIFSDTGLYLLLQNGFYQPTPQDRPSMDRLDLNEDHRVSFEEFVHYYKQASTQIYRTLPTPPENQFNAATTEAIFKLLDSNKDGKLTRDEVQAAEKLIATLDVDEDECLSQNELLGNNSPFGRQNAQVFRLNQQQNVRPRELLDIVNTFKTGRIPGTLIQQLIKKYDKDGDFELTREESGFDDETFSRLDVDQNGKLDGGELEAWRTGPPDLEVMLSFGLKASEAAAKLVTDEKVAAARGFVCRKSEGGRLIVRAGRHPIEFWSIPGGNNGRQTALKQQFAYLFDQAAGKKGYVEEKDLTGPNAVQFQFLRTQFDPADANGDGKLTREEFNNYFDMLDNFRAVSLGVTPTVQTPTLFQLLDENGDGRLSVRELRTAWDRLIALEPPGSTAVTRAAIQPIVSVRLQQVLDRTNNFQVDLVVDGTGRNGVTVPQKGPLWFRKMDRNGDGDVSRSEFLGTREEFDAIDTDHDGLISLEEAEAWDRKLRPAGQKDGPPPAGKTEVKPEKK